MFIRMKCTVLLEVSVTFVIAGKVYVHEWVMMYQWTQVKSL